MCDTPEKTSGRQSKEVNTNLCAVDGDQPENATRFSSTISKLIKIGGNTKTVVRLETDRNRASGWNYRSLAHGL
jgi:hypothetical protein